MHGTFIQRIPIIRFAGLLIAVFLVGCSSAGGDAPKVVSRSQSALSSDIPYLYLECNATGWTLSEANRLQPTSAPDTFTLNYSVNQALLVSSPDTCLIVATNELDGFGTSQAYYSLSNPSTPLQAPGGGSLTASTQDFSVAYPQMANYVVTVDRQQNTISIGPSTAGAIGDCGMGNLGSDPNVKVDYVLVYGSNLSRWCVDANFWSVPANAAAIGRFFGWGDAFIAQIESLFRVTLDAPFSVEVTNPTGGACASCSDFGFGERVTGDVFGEDFSDPVSSASIPGFFGYVLTVHEAINSFTGAKTTFAGWPADWWADHRSPFPNMLDEVVMRTAGTQLDDSTLLAAATAQHERWNTPGLSTFDPEVGMFETIYNQYGGFTPFENLFTLAGGDGLVEHIIDSNTNPSPLMTEYVIAYLQLGMHTTTDLTQSLFAASGVGTLDTNIRPYTVDSDAVRAIATAHCTIRAAAGAGLDPSGALSALQSGNYQNAIAFGGLPSTCPAECTWDANVSRCVAPW